MSWDRSNSEGAVAVMVAIFIAFVGVALLAFALDMGSLRQSQRALVTDTDAAALAGAIELAEDWMENGGECGDRAAARGEAERVLAMNNLDDEVISTDADCEPNPATAADFSGWVQMTASQPSPGFVTGRGDLAAGGTSTAEFVLGVSDFAEGLAVCGDLFLGTGQLTSHFTLDNGNFAIPYKSATQTLVGQLGTACGVETQWFNQGSPANTTKGGWGWLEGVCSPILTEGTWCNVDTGTDDLQKVLGPAVGDEVRFPIFDAWNDRPGTKADLRIVGLMKATVVSTCRISGGGNEPKDPSDCDSASNSSNRFNGQPDFIIVSGARPFFFDNALPEMFDEAAYSICDVQGDRRFCRSRG